MIEFITVRKQPIKQTYFNLYHDILNYRKVENISLSKQIAVTNYIIETNTPTINYIGEKLLK